jgi:NAD-dependent oxidoreductase involved in siderophore biosynthesis
MPHCRKDTNDQDRYVRRHAAEALWRIGLKAKEVVSALSAALNDHDEVVRLYAASALKSEAGEKKKKMSLWRQMMRKQGRPVLLIWPKLFFP